MNAVKESGSDPGYSPEMTIDRDEADELVRAYVGELDAIYDEIRGSIDEGRRFFARAAWAVFKLADYHEGVAGELSETDRADLELDLLELTRRIRDIQRISDAHYAVFLCQEHGDRTEPAGDINAEQHRQRVLDALRRWRRGREAANGDRAERG